MDNQFREWNKCFLGLFGKERNPGFDLVSSN